MEWRMQTNELVKTNGQCGTETPWGIPIVDPSGQIIFGLQLV